MTPITSQAIAPGGIVGGVDTHRDTHTAAALESAGRVLGTEQFPATGRPRMPTQDRPLVLQHHRVAQAISPVPWSGPRKHDTSTARFHVTFKACKRQMYGRAKLDLL
jgi:hypothetical protein